MSPITKSSLNPLAGGSDRADMLAAPQALSFSSSPVRLIIECVIIFIAAELGVMNLLPQLAPHSTLWISALLDVSLVAFLTAPLLYWRICAWRRIRVTSLEAISSSKMAWCLSLAVLLGGSIVAHLAGREIRENAQVSAKAQFDKLSLRLIDETGRRLRNYELALRGARGPFVASHRVQRAEFRAYAQSRNLQTEFPGTFGFGFIQRVKREELSSFIKAERRDDCPTFDVRTSGNHSDLCVVKFIEPIEQNAAALGYDVGSEATRRKALDQSLETGEPTLTARIQLVQDKTQRAGFLYLLPIYQKGIQPTTPEQRRQAAIGWVYAPIIIELALADLEGAADSMLHLEVYDGEGIDPGNLLFEPNAADCVQRTDMFQSNHQILIGGRTWLLHVASLPKFEASVDNGRSVVAIMVGMVLTALLATLVHFVGMGRSRALKLAWQMTQGLRQSEQRATASRIAAEAAATNLAAFKAAVNESALVTLTDAAGNILEVNDQFCALSGYSRDELIGKTHELMRSDVHPVSFWDEMWAAIQSTGHWRGEMCNCRRDGSVFWVDTTISALRNLHGEIERYLAIRFDISERKQAEAELQQASIHAEAANRAKSEFLANMSHEIRTPLTAILGYSELLRDDLVTEPDQDARIETLGTITNAGNHLLTVINDILDLSKIEAGKMNVEEVDTQLADLLIDVESFMRPRATEKGIALSVHLATPIPRTIRTDPTRLRQMILNILGNAVKFTDRGSVHAEISSIPRASGPFLQIDISDTGPGLSPEQTDRLFLPFSQADNSVTRRHGGTGLGLIICRRLAELLDGTVTLIATQLGKGSTFRIEIPLRLGAQARMISSLREPVHVPTPGPAGQQPLAGRILLVEDGIDNQRLIALLLRKAGATVAVAGDGQEAWNLIKSAGASGVDLILTDMQMPGIDGYTLATMVRQSGLDIPVIALTAHAMADDRAKCISAGCDDFITKPIDRTALIETCRRWLTKSSVRAAG